MAKRKPSKSKKKQLIEKLKKHIRTNSSKYLEDPNISSVGIGLKIVDGKRTNDICLQFTVDEKIEISALETLGTDMIPKSIEIEGESIPTDIIKRSYRLAFEVIEDVSDSRRKERADPVFPGISICNSKGTAGTLGCIVYDNDNIPYVLSNWHVLHGDNGSIGDEIVQPGPHDDNRIAQNKFGKLKRSHLGHAGDCAICTIENRSFSEEIFEIGTKVQQIAEPELLDKVVKSGRTTNVTFGVVERIHTIAKLDYGPNTGLKEIGCFEIGIDHENYPPDGEISMGGDSGSVWLISDDDSNATSIMAGLHFAGEGKGNPHEHALACYSKSVFDKLGILPSREEEIREVKNTGYNRNFLKYNIEFPTPIKLETYFLLNDSFIIDYQHFSLALNKDRKFAGCVGWNIDGSNMKRLSRRGINFRTDDRIPNKYQINNDLYKRNDLDRGHLARRADLLWGDIEDAKKANSDSFYYTNIAPQINDFNQSGKDGIWGELENAVFEDVQLDDLKVTIFGGPIFQEDDKLYRGVKIPREYYKVIVYSENEELKYKAFILAQNIDRLEILELDDFKVYEVSLTQIEERIGFNFDNSLYEVQVEDIENQSKSKQIESLGDISW